MELARPKPWTFVRLKVRVLAAGSSVKILFIGIKTSAEKQFLLQNASSLLQNLNLIQPLDENTWTLLVDVGQISSWRLHVGMDVIIIALTFKPSLFYIRKFIPTTRDQRKVADQWRETLPVGKIACVYPPLPPDLGLSSIQNHQRKNIEGLTKMLELLKLEKVTEDCNKVAEKVLRQSNLWSQSFKE